MPDSTLGSLDYIYTPSADVARDMAWFVDVLGAEVGFAIDGMGTRVAMLTLGSGPPILLTDHLAGDAPILVYRVAGLRPAISELKRHGFTGGRMVELPMGSACSFTAPGGQRLALYEASRSFVVESFMGRRDF